MKYYLVHEVCQLVGTTVRSIQYYDDIDLLVPSKRSDAGYRLYSEKDLARLQQIITLKYLGLSLSEIKNILNNGEFNTLSSLKIQAKVLSEKAEKILEASRLLTYIASQLEADELVNWESTAKIIKVLEMSKSKDSVLQEYQSHETDSELGKKSDYDNQYNPERLFPIPREAKRCEIGIDNHKLPFKGFDCWNHYEVSWLNEKGKPISAIAEIYYDCQSPKIIESKSLKLYFNSLNNTKFDSIEKVTKIIKQDLEQTIESEVNISIKILDNNTKLANIQTLSGQCLDTLDIECDKYTVEPSYLAIQNSQEHIVEETLYSHLLKSNCLVTNQPDWGSVQISYKGKQIHHEGLLKYIISFRNHNEFHEQCIERIFVDIMKHCQPEELTVYGRYTRRGGLDINPYRSTKDYDVTQLNTRLDRQ